MAKPNMPPFLGTDIGKLMAGLKVPGVDVETIIASQRKNVEAIAEANQLMLCGVQNIITRQSEIMQQTVEEVNALLSELWRVSTPQERVAQQTLLTKLAFEKSLANVQELTGMITQSNASASDVISKRVSESLEELRTSVARADGGFASAWGSTAEATA